MDQKGRGKTNLTPVLMKYRKNVTAIPTMLIFRNGEVAAAHPGQLTTEVMNALLATVEP